MGNLVKLEGVIEKLVTLVPDQPEPWYDLAALDTVLGKSDQALQNLRQSLDLDARRRKTNSTARNLLAEARKDHRFDPLRTLPAFQKIVPAN
jgi:Flp pilus assembly protein TadD